MVVGGLPNVGATCFMASCLQAVSHLLHVAAVLCDHTCSGFVADMLRRVNKGARINDKYMRTFVDRCNAEFCMRRRQNEQYDAKECFDAVVTNDQCPPLQKVFEWATLPSSKCPRCNEESYYDLSPKYGIQVPLHDDQNVQELVDSALDPSAASRRCECGYDGPTPLSETIMEYPKVMVLQLLRFDNALCKICSHNDHQLVPHLRVGGAEGRSYSLRAAIEHLGSSLQNGHYISYVLDGGEWHKISDMAVSKITEAKVLEVEAYLCFYDADDVLHDDDLIGISQPAASTVAPRNAEGNVNTTPQPTCAMEASDAWTVPRKRARVSEIKPSPVMQAQASRFEVLRLADAEVASEEPCMAMTTSLCGSKHQAKKPKAVPFSASFYTFCQAPHARIKARAPLGDATPQLFDKYSEKILQLTPTPTIQGGLQTTPSVLCSVGGPMICCWQSLASIQSGTAHCPPSPRRASLASP